MRKDVGVIRFLVDVSLEEGTNHGCLLAARRSDCACELTRTVEQGCKRDISTCDGGRGTGCVGDAVRVEHATDDKTRCRCLGSGHRSEVCVTRDNDGFHTHGVLRVARNRHDASAKVPGVNQRGLVGSGVAREDNVRRAVHAVVLAVVGQFNRHFGSM